MKRLCVVIASVAVLAVSGVAAEQPEGKPAAQSIPGVVSLVLPPLIPEASMSPANVTLAEGRCLKDKNGVTAIIDIEVLQKLKDAGMKKASFIACRDEIHAFGAVISVFRDCGSGTSGRRDNENFPLSSGRWTTRGAATPRVRTSVCVLYRHRGTAAGDCKGDRASVQRPDLSGGAGYGGYALPV